MKKNLAKKITLSILAGAMLMSSSVAMAAEPVWGDNSGTNAIAIGTGAEAKGDYSNAIGSSIEGDSATQASGNYSNAFGSGAQAIGASSNAFGSGATASESNSHAFGTNASAIGVQSIAIGTYAEAIGFNSIAIGLDTSAIAEGAIALGYGSVANVEDAVSVGNGGVVGSSGPTTRSIINVKDVRVKDLGNDNYGSYAVNVNTLNAALDNVYTKTEADGLLGKKADKADTLAGYGITDAYTKTEVDTELGKKADKTELEAEATTRAEKDNELLARIDLVSDGAADAIAGINQRLDKTNTKINRVGAGAAALAALHPLDYDPDDKLTFSAGMGNYAGENAAALGAFYRPNEKFMVSLGGTMGNGENMVNLGLSIGLDKPNGYAKLSKRELIQEVNAVKAENNMLIQKVDAVEAENEAIKAEMVEMKAMLQAIMAKK